MTATHPPCPRDNASGSIGVLIATYCRPGELARCLRALAGQLRQADEVLVVVRDTDAATRQFLESFHDPRCPVRMVPVSAPGLVAARNAGLAACRTDVLAMVDDDAVPYPDWIQRIGEQFSADPWIGGLGGRDRCHDGRSFDDRQTAVVGRIKWFGGLIGNHHIGSGPARDVDFLKGANMSYRAQALADMRFNTRLRGSGAVPHEDLDFSIAVRRRGWRLRYDPQLVVDHYAAPREEPRHYAAVVGVTDAAGFSDNAFNTVIALWNDLSPPRRTVFALWSLLVGTRTCPGLVQAVRFTPKLRSQSWRRFALAQRGMFAAYRTLLTWGRADESRLQITAAGSAADGDG